MSSSAPDRADVASQPLRAAASLRIRDLEEPYGEVGGAARGTTSRKGRRVDGCTHLAVVAVRAGQLAQDFERTRVVPCCALVDDLPTLGLHVGGVESDQGRLGVRGTEGDLGVVLACPSRVVLVGDADGA